MANVASSPDPAALAYVCPATHSILYLLVNEEKSSFKIGITDDLEARYARLSAVWGTFDLASSCTVTGTRQDISRLEKTLHYLLEKWRVQQSIKTEGYSEWFSMDCFNKALELISSAALIRGSYSENLITVGIVLLGQEKIYKKKIQNDSNHATNLTELGRMRTARPTSSASIIGEKRGIPVYMTNPSIHPQDGISRPRHAQIGSDQKGFIINEIVGDILEKGDAGIYELEEVGKEHFVKLFIAGVKQAAGLSKAGLAIFDVVYNLVRENPNSDEVKLNLYTASEQIEGINDRTYRRGMRELLDKEFLYRSPSEGVFFVNIRYMFNGDRLAFVKAYHLMGSGGKKRRLPPGSMLG